MIKRVKHMFMATYLFVVTGMICASEQSEYNRHIAFLKEQTERNKAIQKIDYTLKKTLQLLFENQQKYCTGYYHGSCNNACVILNYIKTGNKILDLTSQTGKKILPSNGEMKVLRDIRSVYFAVALLPLAEQQNIYDLNLTCVESHRETGKGIDFSDFLNCMQLSYTKSKIDDKQVPSVAINNHKTNCTGTKPSCQK